jgi:hypothetical protein
MRNFLFAILIAVNTPVLAPKRSSLRVKSDARTFGGSA